MKISIATEDILTEEAMVKIIASNGHFEIKNKLGKQGCGYLTSNLEKFNNLAALHHVLVVLDLDLKENAVTYRSEIENKLRNKHERLKIIIPIREVESWILADRGGLSDYFKISKDRIDRTPDELLDPKEKIITLAKLSKNGVIKRGIPPKAGAAAKVGLPYNTILSTFIRDHWDFRSAMEHSPSLCETVQLIESIENV
ncbi:hypothetical protein CXB03_RS23915 [Escherichia coli]|nr:DUF4276 family protein [Escherichia coli]